MDSNWDRLARALMTAVGADSQLDESLAQVFNQPKAAFTASVEDCRALIAACLPDWHLHLGYGASGMFPYASLTRGSARIISDAPTVPLAILRSAVAAKACPEPSSLPPA